MATKAEELRLKLGEQATALITKLAGYEDAPPSDEQLAELNAMQDEKRVTQKSLENLAALGDMRMEAERDQGSNRRAPVAAPEWGRPKALVSIGERFASMDSYQKWLNDVAPTGVIPDSAKGLHSPSMSFKGFRELEQQAALLTGESSTSAGAFVTPTYYPGLTELGRRPLSLRQVITNLQTDTDTVEFVRVTAETNNAAPVAEATAASGGSGVKPESNLAFERVTTNVKTIAHWIPATKRSLSDASQLRGLIDAFLRYGLDEELEDQIANGDGTGENFAGILQTANTQAQAWDIDVFRTTRVAKRKVRTVGRRIPNAYILNPEDWETIDLKRDNNNQFYGDGPFGMTGPRLWGLPVVESEAIPVGTGLVGDFSTCVLWDREQASISVSDSHSDFFIRNLVAILAELRAAFGVLKPNAIVEIDLTA